MNWEIEIDIYTLMILCLSVKSLQSFLTLWDPMDCSLPGSSVRGEFSRQEYWSGLPCLSPGDLPNPGIEPMSTVAHALQADSLLLSHQGNAMYNIVQRRELSSVLCGDLNGKQIQKRADICTQEKAMAPHFSTLA